MSDSARQPLAQGIMSIDSAHVDTLTGRLSPVAVLYPPALETDPGPLRLDTGGAAPESCEEGGRGTDGGVGEGDTGGDCDIGRRCVWRSFAATASDFAVSSMSLATARERAATLLPAALLRAMCGPFGRRLRMRPSLSCRFFCCLSSSRCLVRAPAPGLRSTGGISLH